MSWTVIKGGNNHYKQITMGNSIKCRNHWYMSVYKVHLINATMAKILEIDELMEHWIISKFQVNYFFKFAVL